jgi:hypothetical protein
MLTENRSLTEIEAKLNCEEELCEIALSEYIIKLFSLKILSMEKGVIL